VGLRLLKPQGLLFHDGSDRHHHAVISNQWEWEGGRLLNWHREKAVFGLPTQATAAKALGRRRGG
jgi:hypothetical protein